MGTRTSGLAPVHLTPVVSRGTTVDGREGIAAPFDERRAHLTCSDGRKQVYMAQVRQ